MPDERELSEREGKLAKAYAKNGKLPSDAEDARIVDALITEGVIEAAPQEHETGEAE